MLCTFCGTENRPENKFCGMCGVRLERRQAERRIRHETLKCQSCGHLNDLGHRFCGMCGARTDRRMRERRTSPPEQARASAVANVQLPPPEAPVPPPHLPPSQAPEARSDDLEPLPPESPSHPRTPPAIFRSETPHVSGPSFLGLGDETQNTGAYLLEEDEGASRGMLRRLVLIAILAAIAGLIFVGWRSTFRANPKSSPTPAAPAASPSPSSSPSPPPQGKEQDPPSDPARDATSVASPGADTASDVKAVPAMDVNESISPKSPARAEAKPASGDKRVSAGNTAVHGSPGNGMSGQRRPSAMLLRAQKYLQGRGGVRQNCAQGLVYLKAAVQKNEPAAAVQMGALYSSGHCVQRNEVTAYRWFNSAHELEPANLWIQANLDRLWERMTPQQRRQVEGQTR